MQWPRVLHARAQLHCEQAEACTTNERRNFKSEISDLKSRGGRRGRDGPTISPLQFGFCATSDPAGARRSPEGDGDLTEGNEVNEGTGLSLTPLKCRGQNGECRM